MSNRSPSRPRSSAMRSTSSNSTRTKSKSRSELSSSVNRLATPTGRVEYLDTPGPYSYTDVRDQGRIPYVIRTSDRWPETAVPMRDRIECDRSAIEPKPVIVVFSTEDRWQPNVDNAVTKDASSYDVESGYKLTEPRPIVASIAGRAIDHGIKKETPLQRLDIENHLTIANSSINGGAMSHGTRSTIQSFILHTESPGPIYNPSFAAVEPQSGSGIFSSQQRLPPEKVAAQSSLTYDDSISQEDRLSTRRRAPNCIIGSVPKVFPLPFNVYNVCNSRSMRTKLCQRSSDILGTATFDSAKATQGSAFPSYVMSATRRSRSPNTMNWKRPASSSRTQQRSQSQQSMMLALDEDSSYQHQPANTSSHPAQSPEPRGPKETKYAGEEESIINRTSEERWLNRQARLRTKEQDPKRFVAADSPFSANHYVPPARRTVVLCKEKDLHSDEAILKKMGSKHVHVAPGSRGAYEENQVNYSMSRRPATGNPRSQGSKAVERFRTNVVNAQAKRYGAADEQQHRSTLSKKVGSEGGGEDDDVPTTHPRAVQYQKKFPALSVDEGYHSKVFQSHVQHRLDEVNLPEDRRATIATGSYRWDTVKKAKEAAGLPIKLDEYGRPIRGATVYGFGAGGK